MAQTRFKTSDFTEETMSRKRRSSLLRDEGETTFVAQMTVFDKNRYDTRFFIPTSVIFKFLSESEVTCHTCCLCFYTL